MAVHEVVAEHRTWGKAFGEAFKMAGGQKRRGRSVYKHHVKSVVLTKDVRVWQVRRPAR